MPEIIYTLLFLIINGLIWGSIVALIALGLSLIFGVMGIVNMAHGDLYMLGAVFSFCIVSISWNFWLSLILVPFAIILISAPIERFILRQYEGRHSATMIATLGISFIIQQIVLAFFGGNPKKMLDPWPISLQLLGTNYPCYRLLIACLSVLILIGIWLLLYKTSYGIFIRASIQDSDMASAMGIDVNKVLTTTFVMGCVLAGVGGVLAAPINQVYYLMGNDVMVLSFIVVIVGGMGSLKGTLIAALTLCSLEGAMVSVLSPTQARVAIFIIMIGVVLRRPRGLFGTA